MDSVLKHIDRFFVCGALLFHFFTFPFEPLCKRIKKSVDSERQVFIQE